MIKQQLEDSFEALAEQGATQTKKAVKSAVQQISSSVSATKMWEQLLGVSSTDEKTAKPQHLSGESWSKEHLRGEVKNSHTPLNFEKLAKSYQNADQQKTEQLKNRLFQLVKQGEEKVLYDKKRQEQEKKQKEVYEAEEKKRRQHEAARQQSDSLPQGKVRRSIFSKKKIAQREHTEVKPSQGKQ